jgi:hypothetical protein
MSACESIPKVPQIVEVEDLHSEIEQLYLTGLVPGKRRDDLTLIAADL